MVARSLVDITSSYRRVVLAPFFEEVAKVAARSSRELRGRSDTPSVYRTDVLVTAVDVLYRKAPPAVAGSVGVTPGQALGDLETAGLVRRRVDGRAYRWQLRDDNVLVHQIRQLARVQDADAAQVVVDALGAEPVSITLFGSTARGESGAGSDIDLLLVATGREQDLLLCQMP